MIRCFFHASSIQHGRCAYACGRTTPRQRSGIETITLRFVRTISLHGTVLYVRSTYTPGIYQYIPYVCAVLYVTCAFILIMDEEDPKNNPWSRLFSILLFGICLQLRYSSVREKSWLPTKVLMGASRFSSQKIFWSFSSKVRFSSSWRRIKLQERFF